MEKRENEIDYVFVDTPGQIEIFTWSASGAIITEAFASTFPTIITYMVDTPRSTNPVTFMSNMLYACSILYKTRLPLLLAFNKVDVAQHQFAIEVGFILYMTHETRNYDMFFMYGSRVMEPLCGMVSLSILFYEAYIHCSFFKFHDVYIVYSVNSHVVLIVYTLTSQCMAYLFTDFQECWLHLFIDFQEVRLGYLLMLTNWTFMGPISVNHQTFMMPISVNHQTLIIFS